MNWSLITATNDEATLSSCLLGSGEAAFASEVILQRNYSSAASAYNSAIEKATTDILVFAHQDVYLPAGWHTALDNNLASLDRVDPSWGVLGIWGVKSSGIPDGHLYCNALGGIYGGHFKQPVEVRTLDEVLLIVRKSSGLKFDERLPGFHLYGTDICLEAQRRGRKCYAISAFCIHNASTYNLMPVQFWHGYFFMRKKWRAELPVITPCIAITRWCWPVLQWNLVRRLKYFLKPPQLRKRVSDPASLQPQSPGQLENPPL